jgi:hypothetical protein
MIMRFILAALLLLDLAACDNRAPTTAAAFLSGFNGVWQIASGGSAETLRWYYNPGSQKVVAVEALPFESLFLEITPDQYEPLVRQLTGTAVTYSAGALLPATRKQMNAMVRNSATEPDQYRLLLTLGDQVQQYNFVRGLQPDEIAALQMAIDNKRKLVLLAPASNINTNCPLYSAVPVPPKPEPPDNREQNQARAAQEFDFVYNNDGTDGIEDTLTSCYSDAADKNSSERLSYCITLDKMASEKIRQMEADNNWPANPVFDPLIEDERIRTNLVRMGYTDSDRQATFTPAIDVPLAPAKTVEIHGSEL